VTRPGTIPRDADQPDDAAGAVLTAAILTVDLPAIVANWRLLCARHPSGPVAAVVKADGYGLGAPRIAATLHAAGCRHFFVALLDEALAIRHLVPGAMVAVLGGPAAGTEGEYARQDITPVLGSLAEIEAWTQAGGRAGQRLPAIVHVDTGMSRLGLDARELAILQRDHGRLAGIGVEYVMSHLAAAEVPDDPANEQQRLRFADACAGLPPARRSLANSSGIFLGPPWGSDLARPGAALYGINPTPEQPNPMQPVVSLRARVLAVRAIPVGAAVGYNAIWRAARPSRIATVGIGYADGWHRALSNRGMARFDGNPVPLVGRVSMDLSTFDVTDHPAIQPGSWLELLGPHQSPDDVARMSGTNGYEVLTSLARRVHRSYLPA
jgi:alanine racemase